MSLSSTHTDDVASLLQRCAQKDPGSLRTLINLHGPTLHRYACGLFTKPHAEQLTLDSFALVWQHANLYHPSQGDAFGWIVSIFRYRLAQALGSTRFQRAVAPSVDQLLNTSIPDSTFINAFRGLSAIQQKLLLGRYLFAWDTELSRMHTDLPKEAIEQQIQHACYELSSMLGPWKSNDLRWQANNALACIESLRPQTNQAALQQQRQSDPNAMADALRWEALCADCCQFLPRVTVNEHWLKQLETQLGIHFPPNTPPHSASISTANHVLKKEAVALGADRSPSDSTQLSQLNTALHKQQRATKQWKLFALVNLILILGLLIGYSVPKPPPIEIIQMAPRLGAVLQAPGHSATPGWVLSVDPQDQVLLSPLVPTELRDNEQVHLWTRYPHDSHIRSLGLIDPNQPVTLTPDVIGLVQEGQLFEMTLEQSGRAQTNEPQGPILFMGRVVRLGAFDEAAPAAFNNN